VLLELIDFGDAEGVVLALEVDLLFERGIGIVVTPFSLAEGLDLHVVLLHLDSKLESCLV
jgi:hypothetical protein